MADEHSSITPASRADHLASWRWKKGGPSPNPNGRPRKDLAAEIAQAVFENNREAVYRAMAKRLKAGDSKTFAILAERAYGKLKEILVEGEVQEISAADLVRFGQLIERIKQYEKKEAKQIDVSATEETK